jgi:hypothetical protein
MVRQYCGFQTPPDFLLAFHRSRKGDVWRSCESRKLVMHRYDVHLGESFDFGIASLNSMKYDHPDSLCDLSPALVSCPVADGSKRTFWPPKSSCNFHLSLRIRLENKRLRCLREGTSSASSVRVTGLDPVANIALELSST